MTTAVLRANDMLEQDPDQSLTKLISGSGWTGIIGGVIIALIPLLLKLRQMISSDSVSSAANAAQTELINLLRDQIKTERKRADDAEAERDKAVESILQLKEQIETLTDEVRDLRKKFGVPPAPILIHDPS